VVWVILGIVQSGRGYARRYALSLLSVVSVVTRSRMHATHTRYLLRLIT